MKISENFSLSEMTKSHTANKLDIEEQFNPPQEIIDNIVHYVKNGIQPVRTYLGIPIRTVVGYRCKAVNDVIPGASKTSDHLTGSAGDHELYIDGEERNDILAEACIECIKLGYIKEFNQLILEHPRPNTFGGETPNYRWIHLAVKQSGNKNQILEANKNSKGKTYYIDVTEKYLG